VTISDHFRIISCNSFLKFRRFRVLTFLKLAPNLSLKVHQFRTEFYRILIKSAEVPIFMSIYWIHNVRIFTDFTPIYTNLHRFYTDFAPFSTDFAPISTQNHRFLKSQFCGIRTGRDLFSQHSFCAIFEVSEFLQEFVNFAPNFNQFHINFTPNSHQIHQNGHEIAWNQYPRKWQFYTDFYTDSHRFRHIFNEF